MPQLSTYEGVGGLKVVRDAAFDLTGKLSTPLPGLLAPLRSERWLGEANACARLAAVITTPALADRLDGRLGVAVASEPEFAHAEVHARLAAEREAALRASPTLIDPAARVDGSASVAGHGVVIGAGAFVGPGCVILPGSTIEPEVVLHASAIIGVAGFQAARIEGHQRIAPQLGGARVRRGAELLAHVTVARALFGGETAIGEEVLADCHVYIAHDCVVGRRVQLCAHANVMGRVEIGEEAYIGPSAVIVNGARIGPGAKVSMGAVVTRDVPAGATVTGNFAIPHHQFLANLRASRGASE
jgi:UDP-3-O-[3-hydroxymyristoyl] glucosamine N-acyltransferase